MKFSVVLSAQPAAFKAATFQGDLEENLAAIAGLGYQGVELAIREPDALDTEALLALTERHGLLVSAIGTGQAFGEEGLSLTDPSGDLRAAAVDRLRSHFPMAEKTGAVVILGLIRGVPPASVESEQSMDWLVEALKRVGGEASDRGVQLALEPITRGETPLINTVEQGLQLCARVGEPGLGLLLDTYHMHIEERSPVEAIGMAGDRLVHFHVADSNRHYPGAGELDFAELLGALDGIDYTGWVSGEFLPEPDAHTAAERAIAHLVDIRRSSS